MSGLDLVVVAAINKLIAYWSTTQGLSSLLSFLIIGGYGATIYEELMKARSKKKSWNL